VHSRISKVQKGQEVEEQDDDTELQGVQPRTILDDHPLPVWEAYRDWLRLMVSYFDAARTVSNYVNVYKPSSMSIKVLAIPFQGQEMLPWTQLASMFFEPQEVDFPSNLYSTSANTTSHVPYSTSHSDPTIDPLFTDPFYTGKAHADSTLDPLSTEPPLTDDMALSASEDSTNSEMEELSGDVAWVAELRSITSAAEFTRAIEILWKNSLYFQHAFDPISPLSLGNRFVGTMHCKSIIACFIYVSAFIHGKIDQGIWREFLVRYQYHSLAYAYMFITIGRD